MKCVVAITLVILLTSTASAQVQQRGQARIAGKATASTVSFVFPGASWATRTPAQAGFNTGAFDTALAALPDKCMVVRQGYSVGTKGSVTTTGLVWSASKSVVALVFARLLQQGSIALDDTVPNSDEPTTPTATYRQFLSMTSDWNLDAPSHSPGNHFAYNNGAYHFVGTDLKSTHYASQTHVQMLQNSFVTSLGFEDTLGYNTSGYMSGWDGGWSMSTRDMMRIAYLVLRGGNWNGTQLLSASFINSLYSNQLGSATASTDNPSTDPFAGSISNQFNNETAFTSVLDGAYSFGFWLPTVSGMSGIIEGSAADTEAIAMLGAFGTSVYVSRQRDLIVGCVNTGGTTTNPGPMISGNEFDAFVNALN